MSGPIVQVIEKMIILSGGTGHFDFQADGKIDTAYVEPQAPNDQATYDYFISSNDNGSGRFANTGVKGARVDDVSKLVQGNNRFDIVNCTGQTATIKIVLYVERSQ